ncbi:phospholipid phosphatase-related protein type 2 isoform X2 [Tachyglossus aculeatus]|uniref:phospholipid phosphatase-related protein type 2 isoform X2 n=1 Tax=Tachyglossus aculeatus TaxID=9261 RepID=UPI0018F71D20|nr:phospholipid phosphatase-related protein type 2 isoform X2 [Tachyglossus aculeatus]
MAGRKPELKRSFSIIPCFVFVELVILAAVVLLAYQLEYTDTFPVHVQGFFCYDSTYAKPYPGPEEASRAPPVLVYSLVTAGPTLTILMGEMAFAFFPSGRREEKTIISGDCCYFSPALRRLVRFLGVYSFGLFTTTIFANAGQVVTGNPTPHFLSVCRPNYTALGCQPPTAHYVTDLGACAGNPLLVTAARKAFPSKDAALCAYAVVYTVMYVTLVFKLKGSRLAKPSVCLALLCPAFLVGVVRVAEYRNHWSDVLAGFLTGGAIATFLVTCVVNKFQSQRPAGRRGALPESLGTKPTMALPCVDSPLEKLSVAQDPSSPTPLLQPVCHTPPKSQSCVRSGHLIPSCVSSRGPPMCSSPRARSRAKSEPSQPPPPSQSSSQPQPQPQPQLLSPGHGGAGGGGRGRKMLLPTPLLRDFYTLSGLYPSPFHRDSFSPYLFASRDHLL